MLLQIDDVLKVASYPWESLSIAGVFAIFILLLLYDRKLIKKEQKDTNEELSKRITNHMEDIKELSSMNGEISNKFEKVFQNLILILEMVKTSKNDTR